MENVNAARMWVSKRWVGLHRAWTGVFLLAVCWPLNWALSGARTAIFFFPLWLGYILVVDSLVERRTGSSLWLRSRARFGLMFLFSAPLWWLFEAINRRTGNWQYLGGSLFNWIEYFFLSTLCFSVVVPAVFETAELARSFRWVQRLAAGPRIRPTPRLCRGLLVSGMVMLGLMLIWPRIFYPFAWTSLVLILEPLNRWSGHPHLLQDLEHGDWRKVIALALGALICGLFWEMWNYYSFPKWTYHTPGAGFLHIFEMPLLGYLGYIPFGLEVYELKNFFWPNGPRLRL